MNRDRFMARGAGMAVPQRIAVIGSGIAGLSAAWLLAKRHTVTLYEANDYLGGHSNTVDVAVGGRTIAVDTGFIVYNQHNYPNLAALFVALGVATEPSDMSFSVSIGSGRLEYGRVGLSAVFGQRRNLLRPRFWRLLCGIREFYRRAPGFLDEDDVETLTLGELLVRKGCPADVREFNLVPMAAAIWSASIEQILRFPAAHFIRFFD